MEYCARMSSYTELTPVTSCSSSTNSESDGTIYNSTKQQNINEFHRLVGELDFDSNSSEERYPEIQEIQEIQDDDVVEYVEEDEDEDVAIKYPYERKDAFEDLQQRIEQRLNDSGDQELEKRAREIQYLLETSQAQWKAEEKLEREQSNLRIQDDDSIYTCVMCSKAFSDSEQLQRHTEKAHDLSGQKLRCNLCGKGYKHKKNLDSHMSLHRQEFKCEKCSLVFQSSRTLITHVVTHHSEQDIAGGGDDLDEIRCKYCKGYYSEKIIKGHEYHCKNKEQIALKRKLLKAQSVPSSPALSTVSCASFNSYQPASTSSRSPMVSPIVSYRDKSCRVCGETFASRQSMLRHVGRKHPEAKDDPNVTAVRYVSTESPTHQYACTECGKRLTTRAALTTHRLRAHSSTNRHECTICHKSYTVPSELRKHIQRVHQNKNDQQQQKGASLDNLPELDDIF